MFQWVKNKIKTFQNVLEKTKKTLSGRLQALFNKPLDASTIDKLEEIFYEADLGSTVIKELIKNIKAFFKNNPEASTHDILCFIEQSLVNEMSQFDFSLKESDVNPTVMLIVGTNGNGKTTSIAKLAHAAKNDNKTVLLAAADTFRAGAQEQLQIWADKLHVGVIRAKYQADPAAVAFDATHAAQARNTDLLIIDTAGRLENKEHLQRELEKIKKSCNKALAGAPHEVLLVIDATVGQNGIEQAKAFHACTNISGIILTKLDGSAKGGVVIAIQKKLQLPIKFITFGETIEDLMPFDPKSFVHSLLFEK